MRYAGDTPKNFETALAIKDANLFREMFIDEVAFLIKDRKETVIQLLNKHGLKLSKKANVNQVINAVVKNIYSNNKFRNDLISLFGKKASNTEYQNFSFDLIGKIADAASSIFGTGGQSSAQTQQLQQQMAQQQQDMKLLYEKLLEKQQTNWTPIILITGAIIITGIILAVTLKPKK